MPEDWKLEVTKVKTVCDLFITGLPEQDIRPFRLFHCSTLARRNQCGFFKAKYIYKTIKRISGEIGLVENERKFTIMDVVQCDAIFEQCFEHLLSAIKTVTAKPVSKPGELSVATFYDYLKRCKLQMRYCPISYFVLITVYTQNIQSFLYKDSILMFKNFL